MKAASILAYSVVVWTLLACGHARRIPRSLDVEGGGGNLTQKHSEEVLHSDVLQHFTTTPKTPTETPTRREQSPSFNRDVPGIPEDINVQSLKNDDNFHVKYDAAKTSDKQEFSEDSSNNRKETVKSVQNDVIFTNFNETKPPSSDSDSQTLQSYVDRLSPIDYDEKSKIEDKKLGHEVHPAISSTQILKSDTDWKAIEMKKKEKVKKEILETVTVSSDHIGAAKAEKPYKDGALNVKLKERTKDTNTNTEALDERRSTTIRISISNSSRSSDSISEQDNIHSVDQLEDFKVESPSSNNNEEVAKLIVNSVINGNGVNSEASKKTRVKYSPKRDNNDTEVDHSSATGNLLNEDATNDSTSRVNLYPQVTYSTFQTSTTSAVKMVVAEQKVPIQQLKPTDSTPTKVDIFAKPIMPSPTTVVKPSIAFKQQIANKLKSLEPAPTMPIAAIGEDLEENQDKSGKSSTKSSSKKKPRPDYHAPSLDMHIPPTATAWTLVSMKSAAEKLTTSRNPSASIDEKSSTTENFSATGQTTVAPVTRVKSFVPWSTRLLKTTTFRPSTTPEIFDVKDSDGNSLASNKEAQQIHTDYFEEQKEPSTSKLEEKSVIRTTKELERNMTETSNNLIPSSLNNEDFMVKDQSSTKSQETPTTAGTVGRITSARQEFSTNISVNVLSGKNSEKENVIDTKIPDNDEIQNKREESSPELLEDKTLINVKNKTVNEVLSSDLSQSVNEIKLNTGDENHKMNTTKSSSALPQVDSEDLTKILSEVHDSDPAPKDMFLDGAGDDGKSEEESEEDEKPKQTTMTPPKVENFETTFIPDLDEDEGDGDRDDDELPAITDKLATTNPSKVLNSTHPTETKLVIKPTNPTLPRTYENSTGTYVTSFDIISKDNLTQEETKTPTDGDINWYSVDIKPVMNVSDAETSPKTVPVTTTASIETTIAPEITTTEMSMPETTMPTETTKTVMNLSTTPTSVLVSSKPAEQQEDTVHAEDANDTPMACVMIVVRSLSPLEFCRDQRQLRENIAAQLINENVSWEQVHVVSRSLQQGCGMKDLSEEEQPLEVEACFVDKDQEPSVSLRDEFLRIYGKKDNLNFPIVDISNTIETPMMGDSDGFDNVLAAIVLSVIAAICLVLLGILLVIVRKRQGTFNYGQRCTPVSLDDYSLDNISVYNSVRRKGNRRASKRSYGNPAFDDPGGPSHSVNFAGLANFSNDREALNEEFAQIPMITVKSDELPPDAESKNRYANVIPLPETRVQLQVKEGADSLKEYINANFIKGPKGQDKLYIACQGPMQSTVEDFWRMVWQQQTKVILMLTALSENGVEKCADYLPHQEITDCNRLFGDFQVILNKHEAREKYIVSHLQLKNLETNQARDVTHLWYSSWPDKGVPDDGSAMIAFLIEARSYTRGALGPTVVHCSPGTGRTGTVIAIDLCIRDFETQRAVDIPKTVYALRRDRAGAVQTKDQYAFIYQVLNLYATKLTGGALDSI